MRMNSFEFILSFPAQLSLTLFLSFFFLPISLPQVCFGGLIRDFEEDTSSSSSSPSPSLFSLSWKLEKRLKNSFKRLQVSFISWIQHFQVLFIELEWFLVQGTHKSSILWIDFLFRFKREFQVGDFHLKFKLEEEVLTNKSPNKASILNSYCL